MDAGRAARRALPRRAGGDVVSGKIKWFLIALFLTLALDQGTKIWARHELKPRSPETIKVVPGYFELQYAENTGAAFSLLRGRPEGKYLLFPFGIIALGVVGVYLKKASPDARRLGAWLGLLAGGAIGNLIDRVFYGYVTDFVLWRAGSYRWPNFNIADAALVIGIIGLLFDLKPEETKAKKKAA
jgi:signal peptidase II